MGFILLSVKKHYARVYLDAILINFQTECQQLQHTRLVRIFLEIQSDFKGSKITSKFLEAYSTLKLKSCAPLRNKIDHLWHVIHWDRTEIRSQIPVAIDHFRIPTTETELHSVTVLYKYLRMLVLRLACFEFSLMRTLLKSKIWELGQLH